MWREFRLRLADALRQFVAVDLRASYLIIGGFVLLGIAVNLWLPHGWTVWPAVLAVGMLVIMNEATDRNGEGVPPLFVYGTFASVIVAWILLVIVLRMINPIVILIGVAVLVYQCGRGYMKHLAHQKLVKHRIDEGLCVFCGEPGKTGEIFCASCGEPINPDGARTRWSTLNNRNAGDVARTRAALKPESAVASMKRKEQELLAKRHRKSTARRS
jgi:hypothetical protein